MSTDQLIEQIKIENNKGYNLKGYVIKIDKGVGKDSFYALDSASGGYPYLSPQLRDAYMFKTVDDAREVIETNSVFNKSSKMNDGTVYPPYLLQSGANLNADKDKGKCTIFISPILVGPFEFSKTFDVEIKRPK